MRPSSRPRRRRRRGLTALAALQLALLAVSCSPDRDPRPLVIGEDACAFCRMAITDPRYGAQVRTGTGRVHTFDAVECLAGFVAAAGDTARFAGVWVVDFETSEMIPVERARFVSGGSLHSPMGRQLTAFAPTRSADDLVARYGGEVLSWPQVLALPAPVAHGTGSGDASSHRH